MLEQSEATYDGEEGGGAELPDTYPRLAHIKYSPNISLWKKPGLNNFCFFCFFSKRVISHNE